MLFTSFCFSQHNSKIYVRLNAEAKTLLIKQELDYNNTSNPTITSIVLNDWNNSYSSKNSALAKGFSDEFIRAFHLAKDEDRGHTNIKSIVDDSYKLINWDRTEKQVDLVNLKLNTFILPFSRVYLLNEDVKA